MFIMRSFLEQTRCPAKLYQELAEHVTKTLPPCQVEDFFFEQDDQALRMEMRRSCADHKEGPNCPGEELGTDLS